MPCYTEILITVTDEAMAKAALTEMGIKGKVVKNANGTYSIELDNKSEMTQTFKDKFFQEYGVQVATAKAEAEHYTVVRDFNEETQEVELTLRQY